MIVAMLRDTAAACRLLKRYNSMVKGVVITFEGALVPGVSALCPSLEVSVTMDDRLHMGVLRHSSDYPAGTV